MLYSYIEHSFHYYAVFDSDSVFNILQISFLYLYIFTQSISFFMYFYFSKNDIKNERSRSYSAK